VVIAIYLLILVAAFYFLIVRPQRRQQQFRRQVIAAVREGDEIITSGGVFATVVALDDETLDVEIAPGVVVTIARGAVQQRILNADADTLGDADDEDGDTES
jgi:preprotein translocase subunit YajC